MLDEFAPQSLLPSLISGMALADLRTFLEENFWDEDPDALSHLLSSAAPPDRTVQSDAELFEVGPGQRGRCPTGSPSTATAPPGEFDLAAPRWREQPAQAEALAPRLTGGDRPAGPPPRARRQESQKRLDELRGRLALRDRPEFDRC